MMTEMQSTTDTKAERKRLESVWWAGALIWLGLVLGAENLNILPQIGEGDVWWIWIFLGLGVWGLALNGYRVLTGLPNPSTWDWIWTAIFLVVGVGGVTEIAGEIVGAVALIGIGLAFLFRAISRSD